jgi:hypothetical protein
MAEIVVFALEKSKNNLLMEDLAISVLHIKSETNKVEGKAR